MSSIKNLKKDINYVLGDIIDLCIAKNADPKKKEALVDEVIDAYDDLIAKVNTKKVEDKKAHFKTINSTFETQAISLLEKVNQL